MKNTPTAVMDAAVIYGASRWLRAAHKDILGTYHIKYSELEDKLLFIEFLHNILLYDSIILDNSSLSKIGHEISDLFSSINSKVGFQLLACQNIASNKHLEPVIIGVCRLIKRLIENESCSLETLLAKPIPWAYKTEAHYDYNVFKQAASDIKLNSQLIPFAIFAYRGLCYAGYSNNLAQNNSCPAVYLASPGRLHILTTLLSNKEISKFTYVRHAYSDLVQLLKLPNHGYNFSYLQSLTAFETSDLALELSIRSPQESIHYVLNLRESSKGQDLRKQWSERIWNRSQSATIGATYSQSIENTWISGNVVQIIHGSSED